MKNRVELDVAGRKVAFSNLEKVFYKESGFTKGQVIDYYTRISPFLLPHLKDRPLTLKRFPEGAGDMFFYEKNCPAHRPGWVRTAAIWSESRQREIKYCLANDLPTLLWVANLASIELHTSLSLASNIERPACIIFDLDPGPPADVLTCAQVGLWIREILDKFELAAYPKTSGSKGLQIYVPLNTPVLYEKTKSFARALAENLEIQHPELILSSMKKRLRTGKVFVDWSQNDRHKTTVCVYSLRAKSRPTVSAPVTWNEVERALKKKDASLLVFEAQDVLKRVDKSGDLFAPVLRKKQKLPAFEMAR